MGDVTKGGMTPAKVARRVILAIEHDSFYIFTHPETRDWLTARHRAIEAAFEGEDVGP
jgi:hypothetical protein